MSKFHHTQPEPSADERELLYHLIEECAEVAQQATKILRFGWKEKQAGQPHDNAERLGREIGNLRVIMDMLSTDSKFVPSGAVGVGMAEKITKMAKYAREAGHAEI